MRIVILCLWFFALVACAPAGSPQLPSTLTFVHLNDTYRVGDVEDGTAGGFGRVASLVREEQSKGHEVRILHGGDFLYPSLESQLWNGMQMIDGMNFLDDLAPMYVVAGNHEFDRRTPQALIDAVRASTFDWIGDNYVWKTGAEDVDAALRSEFLFEFAGKRIGVFGLTLHADDGGNDRDYVPTDKDYLGVAERAIAALEEAGADAIVGLTHLHMWQDRDVARLKAAHPTLILVAGGHEHEPEHAKAGPAEALIVKGASNARVVWAIDLTFDADGVPTVSERRIDLDESVPIDVAYQPLQDKWRTRLLEKFPFLEATVGEAAVPLDGREVAVRNGESNWANFIVDQMRGAFGDQPADLAFLNGGTLRIDDFIADDIRFEDIGRTFGFNSFLRLTEMSGAEFRQMLEAGYRGFGPSKGYFPQVSGFRVCVDKSRSEFDRIVSLQVPVENGWQEIEADALYSVVVSDYLYGGGDGYEIPQSRPATPRGSELKYLVLDAILIAQAEGRKIGAPVDPANPRIVLLREGKQPCWR